MEGTVRARVWRSFFLIKLMAYCLADVLTNCLICYFQQPHACCLLSSSCPHWYWCEAPLNFHESRARLSHNIFAQRELLHMEPSPMRRARLLAARSHFHCRHWQSFGGNWIRHISGKSSLGRRCFRTWEGQVFGLHLLSQIPAGCSLWCAEPVCWECMITAPVWMGAGKRISSAFSSDVITSISSCQASQLSQF